MANPLPESFSKAVRGEVSNAPEVASTKPKSEPTMDEILASIRRIISDETPGGLNKGGLDKLETPRIRVVEPVVDTPESEASITADIASPVSESATSEIDAADMAQAIEVELEQNNAADQSVSGRTAPEPAVTAESVAVTPEPVAPETGRISAAVLGDVQSIEEDAEVPQEVEPIKADATDQDSSDTVAIAGAGIAAGAAIVGAGMVSDDAEFDDEAPLELTEDAIIEEEAQSSIEARAPTSNAALSTPPIMSASANQAVAAQFEKLAENLFAGQINNVDQATNALLRPMLREWLDDNLPSLVERLVREEIERVSRGR